jgi:gliding motility-associated-like protein
MRTQLLFLFLTTVFIFSTNNESFAQCPLGVGIGSDPVGFVCKGVPVTYSALPSNGALNPQYIWVVNGDTVSYDSTIINSNPGDIQVYMFSSNCPDTAFNQLVHPIVFYDIDYEVIVEECNQTKADVQINEITNPYGGGVPPYTYDLLTGDGGLGQQELYPDLPVGTYPVLVTDAQGCEDTVWVLMDVVQCPPPIPSQVVTPNGDGVNDYWYIHNIQFYPNNEVFIFDRWGQRVYHKKDYDNDDGWEAKYAGTDMPVSTYYYILEVTLEKSENLVFKGPVSVFR